MFKGGGRTQPSIHSEALVSVLKPVGVLKRLLVHVCNLIELFKQRKDCLPSAISAIR